MDDSHFNLIFEGLDQNAQLPKLISFFQKQRIQSEEQIRRLLINPPKTLWTVQRQSDAQMIQQALKKLGCRILLEPVIVNPAYPFVISKKHYKLLNRELSKILRCKSSLALVLIHVGIDDHGTNLPSMMGTFVQELEEHFRESDTLFGIDEANIALIGFSTDKEGLGYLENKIKRVFKTLLGEKIQLSLGTSLFPEQAQSLPDLIRIAQLHRKNIEQPGLSNATFLEKRHISNALSSGEHLNKTPLQLCFVEARGRIFKRLLDMDLSTLWLGLSQLNQREQEDFLSRIPFDSPLAPQLQEKIDIQFESPNDKKAESHFEAIIGQMELHDWFEDRQQAEKDILTKLSQVQTLPTLSTIAAQVFNVASNPRSTAASLTKVIQNDPALTAKLLKIVNSAFYGFPKKISTIEHTVVILGIEQVMDLAFGLAAAKVFNVSSSKGIYNPKILWHHSLCIALIAQHICQQFPELQKLGAFTAGLLHDFGKIFLMEDFSEEYMKIYNDAEKYDIPLYELEEEKFGMNHAAIGQLLASGWNLPEHLVEAIGFHHRPGSSPNHPQLAAIVGLADYLHYQAIQTGALASETIHVVPCQLTCGHWSFLKQIFKNLSIKKLKEKADNVAGVLNNNKDLFNLLD